MGVATGRKGKTQSRDWIIGVSILMDVRVESKRVNQGFNGEEKYDKKVWKRFI